MSLPAGVTTATVTAGVPVTHTGAAVKTFVSVEPSVFLVHAATGTPLVDFLEELNISEGVAGSFVLPHTDQTGFQDENGNAYLNWYYTARVTYSTPSKAKNKTPKVKVFQLTTGQVTVDLDLLPSGAPALPYIAPSAKVEAFHGRTGAVTLQESDLPERLSEDELSATFVSVQAGGMPGKAVQGLHTRTKPAPAGSTLGLQALAPDPTVTGRLWVQGLSFSQIGFTDDNGTTWTSKVANPGTGGCHQLLFAGGYLWALIGPNADRQGALWRSPLPDASGNGIVFTKMFDLAAPPGGITVGVNSFFRPQNLAVNGANVYLLEYGTTVTGGPSVYYSADSGATWTKVKTWANAKHGHAIHIINGCPVAMLGDSGFTDIGLWRATSAGATVWNRITQYGEAIGGNTLYGIDFTPVTIAGKAMLAIEYDGALNLGPLIFPDTGGTALIWPILKTFELPAAYFGTNRSVTITSEGNMMFMNIGENAAFGPSDSLWISASPFTSATLLDTWPSTDMPYGDPIEVGDYVWFGNYVCRKEKFVGQ